MPQGDTVPAPSTRVLGQLMLSAGMIDAERLAAALEDQRHTRRRLGELLVARGADPEHVARALAAQLRLDYAPPPLIPEPGALRVVTRQLAVRLRVVPLAATERTLRVAMADPLDATAVDDLQFQTGRRVEPVVAAPDTVDAALAAAYGEPTRAPPEPEDVGALRRASEAPTIIALVDRIFERALASRASDIHVEPTGGRLRVRIRVDGVLRPLDELPETVAGAVVSRIKVMADLDISVKRRPQDGRVSLTVAGEELSLRVSTLPADHGEKVVIRLLRAESAPRLEDIGLGRRELDTFRRLLGRGHGLILVTGPTGSGKSTTLFAALGSLDRERRNVITLEDPIEYRMQSVTQVQIRPRAGLDFAAALRAVLRQDPDVIMVGELRDAETLEAAIAAALTGHLVLATLHTNDAPGAVARLLEMGAPPYLVAGTLIGVLAQRLARRLCPQCRVPRTAPPHELRDLGLPARATTVYEPGGCARCDGTGYHGRIGIFELLPVDAAIRERILARVGSDAVRDAARAAGMRTLGEDAWGKVRAGITSLDEVRPLLALLADEARLCSRCGAPVQASFAHCTGCGRRLFPRCACGTALEPGWRYCHGCGTRNVLTTSENPGPDAPAEPALPPPAWPAPATHP